MIPKQLQKEEFRFILVGKKNKFPLEKEWTTVNNYRYNDKKLIKHIDSGSNYGVMGGKGNLVIIDADTKVVQNDINEKLPKTFRVSTSKEGCCHNYFIIDDMDKKYVLDDYEEGHYGEIQYIGSQAVGPNCIHPSGSIYKIKEENNIAKISKSQVINALFPYFKQKDKNSILGKATIGKIREEADINDIKLHVKIPDLMSKYGYDVSRNPTMCRLGHDSKSKSCFSFNNELWNCFHCGEGGDIFSFVMSHDKIDFNEAKKRLIEYSGIKVEEKEPEKKPMVMSLQEIFDNGIPEIEWRVDKIVPKRGTVIFGGTSGSFKTWAAMQLAMSCSIGKPFLEEYETEQCTVLYIDEENGDITIPARFDMLRKGYSYSDSFTNVFVSIFNGIKLDNPDHMIILRNLIKGTDAKLIVIDSMVRCMEGEEDKATDVRRIFDTLKPIWEENKEIAFVILHHTTKTNNRNMAALRGSGDFAAFSDVILMFDTQHKGFFNMEVVKNRHIDMSEFSRIGVKVISEEKSVKLKSVGDPQEKMDAIEKVIEDFKKWVHLKKIQSLPSSRFTILTQEWGHARDTSFKALKLMVERGDLSRLRRGLYKIEFINVIEEYVENE